jgi:quercetin dioxygenase-like cupin family protein
MDLQLTNLSEPSETREFEKGLFEIYHVGPLTVGRATYEPGWRWSQHVAGQGGSRLCTVEHVGLVIEGQAAVLMEDGREVVMKAGEFFYIPPLHDSWVVGDEPYVSLHLLGTDRYAID